MRENIPYLSLGLGYLTQSFLGLSIYLKVSLVHFSSQLKCTPAVGYMYYLFIIHSSGIEIVFIFLAVVNQVAMNMAGQVSVE
jgi:hypothetical protein